MCEASSDSNRNVSVVTSVLLVDELRECPLPETPAISFDCSCCNFISFLANFNSNSNVSCCRVYSTLLRFAAFSVLCAASRSNSSRSLLSNAIASFSLTCAVLLVCSCSACSEARRASTTRFKSPCNSWESNLPFFESCIVSSKAAFFFFTSRSSIRSFFMSTSRFFKFEFF